MKTTMQRILSMLSMGLVAALAYIPYMGVTVMLQPYGGGYEWLPLIDTVPPLMSIATDDVRLVILKRVAVTTTLLFICYMGFIKGHQPFVWATAGLVVFASIIATMSWSKLGHGVSPSGFNASLHLCWSRSAPSY